uniref:AB hydrolase-1 domain-containing protein n=3 Tax=Ascaris TaxID=6251 RepID=A0A9J2PR85_ASCLU
MSEVHSESRSIVQVILIWVFALFWSAVTCVRLAIEWFKHRDTFFEVKEHLKPNVLDGWTHESAQLSEVKLHYVEAGDMDHPLMLMLHGFPEFWYSWRYQIRYFQKNHHVVAVDMRGYNESDKPEGIENYHMSVIAKDIKELISALNHEKAILVGHDWGASIAWKVAAEYPEVVEKLIVLNCPHPRVFMQLLRTNFAQMMKSWYMVLFQMPSLPEFMCKANDYKMLKDAFRSEKTGIKKKEHFTDEDEKAWLFTYSQPNAFTAPINYYRAGLSKSDESIMPSSLIKPKTLIIWGTQDAFIEKCAADMSTKYCEVAEVHFVVGASHWVQQDDPDAVNTCIEKFISEISVN